MSRLIAISNKIPTSGSYPGRLVVALMDALDSSDCIWTWVHPGRRRAKKSLERKTGQDS